MEDPSCIFCKIIHKEISAAIFHETDDFLAFVDIEPNNFGHSLVIPKKHYKDIYEFDEGTLSKLGSELKLVASAVKKAVGAEGINIYMNNERPAGQAVFHAHVHIIPRYINDGLSVWPTKKYDSPEQLSEIRKKLQDAISS